ncbi:Uncharacterized protein APZ42_034211 [Daphnia magna]|uniref:Uncharacterized protein n=1 Tax=Daphnia magna TaxID=35525 RepID=A0A164KCG1_9CRUS|nr:Uncharacterized protein APZ42_034211 [Daphnia magna]
MKPNKKRTIGQKNPQKTVVIHFCTWRQVSKKPILMSCSFSSIPKLSQYKPLRKTLSLTTQGETKPNQGWYLQLQTKTFHLAAGKGSASKQTEQANTNVVEASDSESDDEFTYQVMTQGLKNSRYEVSIDKAKVLIIADSGSTVTLLNQNGYHSLGRPALVPTSVKIFTYN